MFSRHLGPDGNIPNAKRLAGRGKRTPEGPSGPFLAPSETERAGGRTRTKRRCESMLPAVRDTLSPGCIIFLCHTAVGTGVISTPLKKAERDPVSVAQDY